MSTGFFVRLLSLWCAALLLSACGSAVVQPRANENPQPLGQPGQEYVIGVGDQLRISVWKNSDLSADSRVRPDGVITMPLVGDIKAAGKTPSQLREYIVERLQTYIKDQTTVVTVAVVEINSYWVTVAGNVALPGLFSTRHYLSVSDAIAMAGGLNRFASPKDIVVVRGIAEGKKRRIPVDYDAVVSGSKPEANLMLVAGDTVYVP